jgi:hypothetical protein
MSKVTVNWEVEDGYMGKSRPQSFDMDLEDFEGCEDHDDYEKALDVAVQEEFNNNISWFAANYNDVIERAKRHNAEKK